MWRKIPFTKSCSRGETEVYRLPLFCDSHSSVVAGSALTSPSVRTLVTHLEVGTPSVFSHVLLFTSIGGWSKQKVKLCEEYSCVFVNISWGKAGVFVWAIFEAICQPICQLQGLVSLSDSCMRWGIKLNLPFRSFTSVSECFLDTSYSTGECSMTNPLDERARANGELRSLHHFQCLRNSLFKDCTQHCILAQWTTNNVIFVLVGVQKPKHKAMFGIDWNKIWKDYHSLPPKGPKTKQN